MKAFWVFPTVLQEHIYWANVLFTDGTNEGLHHMETKMQETASVDFICWCSVLANYTLNKPILYIVTYMIPIVEHTVSYCRLYGWNLQNCYAQCGN